MGTDTKDLKAKTAAALNFAILEYPGCLASSVFGWRELFALATRMGPDGGIQAREVEPRSAELILVPGSLSLGTDSKLPLGTGIVETLLALSASAPSASALSASAIAPGTVVAAVCAGVEAILAAKLDKGRRLTTHWSLAAGLRERYPQARIDAAELVVDHGDIVTAGGVLAWIDLGLHLVRRFWSPEIALSCARMIVWDPGRRSQGPYAPPGLIWNPLMPDPALAMAEAWIRDQYRERPSLSSWASGGGIGSRSLERRWKLAYGRRPIEWLRLVRIDEARRLLETSAKTWEDITGAVGYSDPASFRVAFEAETGWSPGRYRASFGL